MQTVPTPPETSSDPTPLKEAAPLDYAPRHADARISGAGRRALRIGIECWCYYAFVCLAAIFTAAMISKPASWAVSAAFVVALLFIWAHAIKGFLAACSSLKDERREWRGIVGLIVNGL